MIEVIKIHTNGDPAVTRSIEDLVIRTALLEADEAAKAAHTAIERAYNLLAGICKSRGIPTYMQDCSGYGKRGIEK